MTNTSKVLNIEDPKNDKGGGYRYIVAKKSTNLIIRYLLYYE